MPNVSRSGDQTASAGGPESTWSGGYRVRLIVTESNTVFVSARIPDTTSLLGETDTLVNS